MAGGKAAFIVAEETVLYILDELKDRDGSVPATSHEIKKHIWETRSLLRYGRMPVNDTKSFCSLIDEVLKETTRLVKIPGSEMRYKRFDFKVTLKQGELIPNKKMSDLWRTGLLCDANIISSDGNEFKCHRNVLVCYSDYMFALLADGNRFRDSGADSPINLPEIASRSIELFLEFIYDGKCDVFGFAEVINSLEAASRLQCPDLIEQLEAAACDAVDAETCLGTWSFAERFGLHKLVEKAKSIALANFRYIATQEEFLGLPLARVIELVGDDRVDESKEEHIYFAVLKWVKSKENTSTILSCDDLEELFGCIRYHLLDEGFVSEQVQKEPVLIDNSLCYLSERDPSVETRRKGAFLQFEDIKKGYRVRIDDGFLRCDWSVRGEKAHQLGFCGGRSSNGTYPHSSASNLKGKVLEIKGLAEEFSEYAYESKTCAAVYPLGEREGSRWERIWFIPYSALRFA